MKKNKNGSSNSPKMGIKGSCFSSSLVKRRLEFKEKEKVRRLLRPEVQGAAYQRVAEPLPPSAEGFAARLSHEMVTASSPLSKQHLFSSCSVQ